VVLQDHPASSGVHMPTALILRIIRELPSIACVKEEALPTSPKIRALRQGMGDRAVPILTGLGALYGLFDLEAGSDGFNTGFAIPEVLMAMVAAARSGDWQRVRDIYTRFLPLIVFEQQPGVAVRKEILRLRGAISTNRVRLPGAPLNADTAKQLTSLVEAILPGADLTEPVTID
jgi:4-hydroxy-tetrahydrodipicolinate synthase